MLLHSSVHHRFLIFHLWVSSEWPRGLASSEYIITVGIWVWLLATRSLNLHCRKKITHTRHVTNTWWIIITQKIFFNFFSKLFCFVQTQVGDPPTLICIMINLYFFTFELINMTFTSAARMWGPPQQPMIIKLYLSIARGLRTWQWNYKIKF